MRQALQLFFSRPEGKNLDLGVTRLTGDRERERERGSVRGVKSYELFCFCELAEQRVP